MRGLLGCMGVWERRGERERGGLGERGKNPRLSLSRSPFRPFLNTPILTLLLLAACQPPPPPLPEATAEMLMQADRDFAAAAAERGIDGWMDYLAPDAARLVALGRPALRGLDAIRTSDARLFTDSVRLGWEPMDGGLFADGVHGYTTGAYTLWQRQPDGSETAAAEGHYFTVWRRAADGTWRVILDGGS